MVQNKILPKRLADYSSSSTLIGILHLIALMDSSCTVHHQYHRHHHLGRPYVCSTTIVLRCFMVRMWFRLDSNRSLHQYLSIDSPCNKKVVKACGLSELPLPSRRTFDRRRLKIVSMDIKERVTTMGNMFVSAEGLVKPHILAIDSTLVKAKGHVWHKSSMAKGLVPRPGIDTDARCGFSHTKGWVFGYKLHMVCIVLILLPS